MGIISRFKDIEGKEALERCSVGGGSWYVALRWNPLLFRHT